jgi:hypothetical protein
MLKSTMTAVACSALMLSTALEQIPLNFTHSLRA